MGGVCNSNKTNKKEKNQVTNLQNKNMVINAHQNSKYNKLNIIL